MKSPGESPKILIIDDDKALLSLFSKELTERGFMAHTAQTAEDGLRHATDLSADVILPELLLPDKSGVEIYQRLRRYPQTRHMPILFLPRVLVSPEDLQRSIDMGAADSVAKPGGTSTTLDLLGSDSQPMMDAEQKETLESGRRAGEQLRSIMDNLLEVQRLETGKLCPLRRRPELNEIVQRTVLTILPGARGKGFPIETQLTQVPPALEFDTDLVEQVLENLLDNAINFSPDECTVVVSTEHAGDAVWVSVADEGEGIPERERTCIFEKLMQIRGADMRCGGSRFFFTLPLCNTQ